MSHNGDYSFRGLHWGPPVYGNYYIGLRVIPLLPSQPAIQHILHRIRNENVFGIVSEIDRMSMVRMAEPIL